MDTFISTGASSAGWLPQTQSIVASWAATPFLSSVTPVIAIPMASELEAADPDVAFKDIISGAWDSIFDGIFQAWASAGYKNFYIRPGWEMNGTWSAWYAGNYPEDFVAAFDHIAALAHSFSGASIAVVWCPAVAYQSTTCPVTDLYPGNSYVDVIAPDIYGWLGSATYDPTVPDSGPNDFSLTDAINLALTNNKPFGLSETGAGSVTFDPTVPDDNGTFPMQLASLIGAQTNLNVAFINVWDFTATDGDWNFTGETRPLEEAAWRQAFGGTAGAIITPIRAPDDFYGTGFSDILWRDSYGAVDIWQMKGSQMVSATYVATVGTAWTIAGVGDFSGDGKDDILWRDSYGAVDIWQMNGSHVVSATYVATVGTAWSIAGVGDFSGDGKDDILWRDSYGAVDIWQMNGSQVVSATYVATVGTAWSIAGVGDFSGDGKDDILWRDNYGNLDLWTMNGSAIVSAIHFATVGSSWNIEFIGDFNGDGKDDILWRSSAGAVDLWTMNGSQVLAEAYIGTIGTDWKIEGVGEFNGDGQADILWRNSAGAVDLWTMKGSQVLAETHIATVGNVWQIQQV